jgi:hypothetical protein
MPFSRRPVSSSRAFLMEVLDRRALLSATLVVSDTSDGSSGSLRYAIEHAAAGDVVDARGLSGTITLSRPLDITRDVTILGPGPDRLTITRNSGITRGFYLAADLNVSISGLRINDTRSGRIRDVVDSGGGGAIFAAGDTNFAAGRLSLTDVAITNCVSETTGGGLAATFYQVVLTRCRFAGNTASAGNNAIGGAVYISGGGLSATDSTFDYNTAHATGNTTVSTGETAALGGGVALLGATGSSFVNCTFAHNTAKADKGPAVSEYFTPTAEAYGGGLLIGMDGNLTLANCTFSRNTVGGQGATGFGGGVQVLTFGASNPDASDTLKIVNTVIAANTADAGPDAFGLDVSGSARTNFKSNLIGIGDYSGIAGGTNGNRAGSASNPLDAELGALVDNGGPMPTMMPQSGSPLLGIASAAETSPRDARGYPRSPSYDIGAVERQSNYSPTLDRRPRLVATVGLPYAARVAASDVDGNAITFSLQSAPAWLTLTDHADGTATLRGTPDVEDVGVARMTLRCSDGLLNWDETYDLTALYAPILLNDDGVLRVTGTDASETIHVWQPRGPGTTVRATIGRRKWNLAFERVKEIQIFGRAGDDVIVANSDDWGAYVQAGDGDDTVTGGEHADSLTAAAGDDQVLGMGGNDWIDGNSGRDDLQGGDGDDRIYGGNHRDAINGGVGRDVLYGEGGGDLFITRDRGRDRIFGGEPDINYVQGDKRDIALDATFIK